MTGIAHATEWALTLAAAGVGARLVFAIIRFAMLPRAAKRNYPAALWARLRWRWLVRNLGLSYLDLHRKAIRPVNFGTSVKVRAAEPEIAKMRYPRARIRPDAFGLVATVKTIPKVGRLEFDRGSQHIADAWRCHRVQVHQVKPGRLIIRGLRTDPLTVPFGIEDSPVSNLAVTNWPSECDSLPLRIRPVALLKRARAVSAGGKSRPQRGDFYQFGFTSRLYVGRDEWGTDRWTLLPRLSGITVGGLTGYGKTSLIGSWLYQLAPLEVVQFVIIDGKGGGDYSDWTGRAWIYAGDELPAAAAALEDAHALMRQRFALGQRNMWRQGPTPACPLIVVLVDECHTFLDLDAVKGDKDAEQYVRTCRAMLGQLVRKGRSALFVSVLVTQKQTADAIPTAIRDNCGLGLSFATRTREAAVAALGEGIREYPSYCPTTLQAPEYTGVVTASMPTGHDPFVRLRVPFVDEDLAAELAAATASLRTDPRRSNPNRGSALHLVTP